MQLKISPSLLSADFSRLGEEVLAVAAAGAHLIHVDVMDGHFVPNITIGIPVVASLKKVSPLPLDVHLMIDDPLTYGPQFVRAGGDIVTFHIESPCDTKTAIAAIRDAGGKVGLALKPGTPAEAILPHLAHIDMALIMTVEPGFGGQSFMADMLPKIKAVRGYAEAHGLSLDIQVDGGIADKTAPSVVEAGANVLVAGSAIFGSDDYAAAIAALGA